jgi:hypothetical protein
LVNFHQQKNFGISYMTYILHPSQIHKMSKKMQIQIKKNYVHHVKHIMLAQGQTQGSSLQQRTKKNLTTSPFDNTCKASKVSPEVEAVGLQGSGVCNQVGTSIYDYNYFVEYLRTTCISYQLHSHRRTNPKYKSAQ